MHGVMVHTGVLLERIVKLVRLVIGLGFEGTALYAFISIATHPANDQTWNIVAGIPFGIIMFVWGLAFLF